MIINMFNLLILLLLYEYTIDVTRKCIEQFESALNIFFLELVCVGVAAAKHYIF